MAGPSTQQPLVDDDLEYYGDLQVILKEAAALRRLLGSEYQELAGDFDFDEWERPRARGTVPDQRSAVAPLEERIKLVHVALDSNRTLQQRLRRLLTSVEKAQDKAVGIRERVQGTLRRRHAAAAAPRSHSARKHHEEYTGSSWFWASPDAPPPPPYPDSGDVLAVTSNLPLVFRRTYWNDEEKRMLREGVLQLVQETQLNELLNEMEAAAMTGGGASFEEFEARQAPIRHLTEVDPEVERVAETLRDAEWEAVAHRCVPGRSAIECKLQWLNAAKPSLRHNPFTPEEDAQLQSLVQQHGDRHWMEISKALGGRSAVACLARYQALQQAQRGHREFNLAELDRLLQLCRTHGSSWKRIAEEFGGGWDSEQLMHVWRRHKQRTAGGAVAPRVGRWDTQEDECLHKAVALLGRKWSEVAALVPGRTDVQCRERYMNVLAPEVKNKGAFTLEEDAILQAAVPQHTSATGAISWATVAKQLPGRTDRQCGKRWGVLSRGETSGGGNRGSRGNGGSRGSRGGRGGGGVVRPKINRRKASLHAAAAAAAAEAAAAAAADEPAPRPSKRRKQAVVVEDDDDYDEEEVEEDGTPRENTRGRHIKRPSRFYE